MLTQRTASPEAIRWSICGSVSLRFCRKVDQRGRRPRHLQISQNHAVQAFQDAFLDLRNGPFHGEPGLVVASQHSLQHGERNQRRSSSTALASYGFIESTDNTVGDTIVLRNSEEDICSTATSVTAT